MADCVQGTVFSLMLLSCIIQGYPDIDAFHHRTMERVVGQNVSLPCYLREKTNFHIVQTEWSKKDKGTSKLALYSKQYGLNLFRPTVGIGIYKNHIDELMGTSLELGPVNASNGGVYICDITLFPQGSFQFETNLTVKEFTCDTKSSFEVKTGENVTIQCTAFSGARYTWTKDDKLISEGESLELRDVSGAHTGIYAVTVMTGNQSLHKEFNITVQTGSVSLGTASPHSPPNPTEDSTQTSTANRPTAVTGTTFASTGTTRDPAGLNNATAVTDRETGPAISAHTPFSPDRSGSTDLSGTLSYGISDTGSTQEMITDEQRTTPSPSTLRPEIDSITRLDDSRSTLGNVTERPEGTPSLSTESTTGFNVERGPAGKNDSALLVCAILPLLLSIIGGGVLYRRRMLRLRMDLPPPFKPPPPPAKYSAKRPAGPFPYSQCNTSEPPGMELIDEI